jgi:hypothetical protein
MTPVTALPTLPLIDGWLTARLPTETRRWLESARAEIAAGATDERFCILLSTASRHVARGPLVPTPEERCKAWGVLDGFDPERWTLLETARVALVLAHPRMDSPGGVRAIEEAFRYTDVGEACSLYRSLAHLPAPERFVWRAGEGCRSSLQAVYEAAACDTPYPFRYFDPIAWRQCVLKGLFVGAPLRRIFGLEQRLDAELARMALDFAEERRSAARPVPPDLWLCLGAHGGERGQASLALELAEGPPDGRIGAVCGLLQASGPVAAGAAIAREPDPAVAQRMRLATKL